MNVFTANKDKLIVLGRQGQNLVDTIQFPISKWVEIYGTGGSFSLCHRRSADSAAYPCVITSDANYIYWTIGLADVQYVGEGEAQLTYTIGSGTTAKIAKSEIFKTYNLRSLNQTENPPAAWQSWVDQVEGYADSAEESAEDSEAWAVGQRGGVDVPSTDPTYHNNAKYYAEQGGGTADYTLLNNKPKINNVELVGNKTTADLGITIPTKTSDLTNDSGFLTEHQSLANYDTKTEVNTKISNATNGMATQTWVESKGYLTEHQSLSAYRTSADQDVIDSGKQATLVSGTNIKTINNQPVLGSGNITISGGGAVDSVNGKTGTVVLNATDVGALPDTTSIPSKTSQLTNDSGFLTEHQSLSAYRTASAQDVIDATKANSADLATVATSGSYNDLSNKPTIPVVPTNVSAFTNDAGYLTSHQSLSAYRTSADQDVIDNGKQVKIDSSNKLSDTVVSHGDTTVNAELTSQSSQIVSLGNTKEAKGKMTISNVEHTVVTHTVTIVDSGVTTTMTLLGV